MVIANGRPTTAGVDGYFSRREGGNLWAQSDNFIDASRKRDLLPVRPLTLEFAPTLRCNQACRECPYRRARGVAHASRLLPVGDFAPCNDVVTASPDMARRVLDVSAEAGVRGVVWTGGGEPTVWEPLPDMLAYSASRPNGMINGLYTNGVQFGIRPDLAGAILAPKTNLMFVRVSINAIKPETAKSFSGATAEMVRLQLEGLAQLFSARTRFRPYYPKRAPSIQVSVIVGDRNFDDLPDICLKVANIAAAGEHTPDDRDDDFVVRPLTKHCREQYSMSDHPNAVIDGILRVCGRNGTHRAIVTDAHMNLILGFGLDAIDRGEVDNYSELIRREYERRDYCWANGLFLTVGPDGTAYFCCDRNCQRDWAIGNLLTQSVAEIYAGPQRLALLDKVHQCQCGPLCCEATCRVPRLNQISRDIVNGRLTKEMLEEIRRLSKDERPLLLS